MPRAARIVVPGAAHHLTQRGHSGRVVFCDDMDRNYFLNLLLDHASASDCRIASYCLMTNHVHLVVVPKYEESLARMMHGVNGAYGRHFNARQRLGGPVWQSRFYSCPMDRSHAINALCYVELNPVRARIVDRPEHYAWSAARAHLGLINHDPLLDLARWRRFWNHNEWRRTLETSAGSPEQADTIRRHTLTGKVLGNQAFLERVARIVTRNQ